MQGRTSIKHAKTRNQAIHPGTRLAPTATNPPQVTSLHATHPSLHIPAVPSHSQGHQYDLFNTDHCYSNASHKTPYHFDVGNNNYSAQTFVPNLSTQAPAYQQHAQPYATTPPTSVFMPSGHSNEPTGIPMIQPQAGMAGGTNLTGYYNVPMPVGDDKPPQHQWLDMDYAGERSPPLTSPPMSPSEVPENYPPAASSSRQARAESAGTNDERRRPRDHHRKEIEERAAEKRKTAVKRLSHVLAVRTNGLPENGLANQLVMAAEQLEEDGRTIAGLKKENSELKRENANLKKELARRN